ncbi:MAG: insulinase family protein [Prevotella sp.]|nr:insulinase family protein [Prevotella sp.]
MKNLKLLLAACAIMLGMSAQAKDYKYETVAGDLMKTRIYTLDNGLKVYLSVNPEKPRIQTFVAVRTGSKNDPAETTGLAHYLEHLMFKGTKLFGTTNPEAEAPLLDEIEKRYEQYRQLTDPEARRQAYHEIDSVSQEAAKYFIPNEYDKLMAAIGAEGTNAFTSNDVTCYTEDIPSNEIENWAKIQSDRFQNMVIRGFHTELEAVYEEYNIYLTDDGDKVWSAIGKKLTPTHPYGLQTTIGTQEHLKNPSITNIKNYFTKWYVPNNVAICMAGDFDMDKTIAIIDKYFSGWKPGADVSQPVFPEQKALTAPTDTTVVGQQAEQVYVAWLAKKASDLQCDTLDVISDMLSNGKAGIFDLNLNQTMKVQAAYGGMQSQQDYSSFLLVGQPMPNQSLEDVRSLMLGEIENLKKGNFSDDLLPSVINNMKLSYQRSLENNRWRTGQFLYAFINGKTWEQQTGKMDRVSKMTKQQIVDFANRFFTDGYATVFKAQGVDSTQKKIDKPAITPIQANRDQKSDFVREIQESQVEPIQPVFVDFKKDLTVTKTKNNLPLLYKKNADDDLFTLVFRYDFGHEDDNRYDMASDYLDYVGTDKLSAMEIKQQFYKLACNYSINVNGDNLNISLSGLNENMPAALHLLEDVIHHAKADKTSYGQFVDLILKSRDDRKKDQRTCFDYLYSYAVYGPHNFRRDDMTEQQLREADPQQLLGLLSDLGTMQHDVLYYGPMSEAALSDLLSKEHHTPKQLKPVPVGQPFVEQAATTNEVLIAPYDAKNIYMRMYHNEGRTWNPGEAGVQEVFNEYFGGGMNGIVFQEMREARGLAYNAYAYYYRPSEKDRKEYYMTHIITQNDKMVDCITHFHEILNEMPASETAFQIAKDAVTKRLASARITKSGVINSYIASRKLGLDVSSYELIYKLLDKVTLQDIVGFEKQMMADKPCRYIILGDEKELDMEALEKIGPIRRLTTEEIFGY